VKTVSELTKIGFSDYFKYDESSPSGLIYCKSLINKKKVKGDIAGVEQYDEEEKPKKVAVKKVEDKPEETKIENLAKPKIDSVNTF
jgi:hypothetical protein